MCPFACKVFVNEMCFLKAKMAVLFLIQPGILQLLIEELSAIIEIYVIFPARLLFL
jgi:hypothetical protein